MRYFWTTWWAVLLSTALWGQYGIGDQYVERFRFLAVSEMERTGIPASIKLAQAILESGYGTSDLARESNNHFGIKCGSRWNGGEVYHEDDDRDKRGQLIPSCFRAYSSPEESFVAHSEFLKKPRYHKLFDLDPRDYKGWAKGLKKAGYATNPHYHKKLIDLIERLDLDRYDRMTTEQLLAEFPVRPRPDSRPPAPRPAVKPLPFLINNDVKYVLSTQNESVVHLARRVDVAVSRLLTYNEHLNDREQLLKAGTRVYLQPKRKNYRGRNKWHEVKKGESMFALSDYYGIDLSVLYERNRMIPGTEPAAGARIKLRGGPVVNSPALRPVEDAEVVMERPAPPTRVERPAETGGRRVIPAYPELMKEATPAQSEGDATYRPPATNGSALFHTVQLGETLNEIATRYQTTVAQIKAWNQLQGEVVPQGTRLRVR